MGKFLDFVEIQTKITSMFAFSITMAVLAYHQVEIALWPTAVFFASMFIFDLTTTAINNYIDTKTNDQVLQFPRDTARHMIFAMLGLATALGLYLVYLTDLVVLLAGALCFFCGIVYTYGPVAISRIPLGEALSGVFYGFFIPFILAYINLPQGQVIGYGYQDFVLHLSFNLRYILAIAVVAIVPTLTTANIMLANNTCDLEKDVQVGRFTLVYYIGKEKAVVLYKWLYMGSFAGILLAVIFKIVPIICLGAIILGLPIALKNVKIFLNKQVKAETFVTSIKNYVLINGSLLVAIVLGTLLNEF